MCGSCAAGAAFRASMQYHQVQRAVSYASQGPTEVIPCDFNKEQLKEWRYKLICVKEKGLYVQLGIQAGRLNAHIGNVISAINYDTNPCYFKKQLEEAQEFIAVIVNNELC